VLRRSRWLTPKLLITAKATSNLSRFDLYLYCKALQTQYQNLQQSLWCYDLWTVPGWVSSCGKLPVGLPPNSLELGRPDPGDPSIPIHIELGLVDLIRRTLIRSASSYNVRHAHSVLERLVSLNLLTYILLRYWKNLSSYISALKGLLYIFRCIATRSAIFNNTYGRGPIL